MDSISLKNIVGDKKVLYKCKATADNLATISLIVCLALAFVAVGADCFLATASAIINTVNKGSAGFDIGVFAVAILLHGGAFVMWALYAQMARKSRAQREYCVTENALLTIDDGEKGVANCKIIPLSAISALDKKRNKIIVITGEQKHILYTGKFTEDAFTAIDSALLAVIQSDSEDQSGAKREDYIVE